jgi:hypothetical protein
MTAILHNQANCNKIRQVAEIICGTCNRSLDDVLQEVFGDESIDMMDLDIELLRELDDITQECQGCNWWCETSELDDNQLCEDCRE